MRNVRNASSITLSVAISLAIAGCATERIVDTEPGAVVQSTEDVATDAPSEAAGESLEASPEVRTEAEWQAAALRELPADALPEGFTFVAVKTHMVPGSDAYFYATDQYLAMQKDFSDPGGPGPTVTVSIAHDRRDEAEGSDDTTQIAEADPFSVIETEVKGLALPARIVRTDDDPDVATLVIQLEKSAILVGGMHVGDDVLIAFASEILS